MQRRHFLYHVTMLAGGLTSCVHLSRAQPKNGTVTPAEFDAALARAIANDDMESSRSWRELEFRDRSLTETQTSMAGRKSSRTIHQRAVDFIISSEISSRARYEQRYRRPVWPGGRSGVTIGIGYDLGFVRPKAFDDHWKDLLTSEQINNLIPVCGLKNKTAADRLASVQNVQIEWQPAEKQFERFLPFVIAETENAFPNCDELSDMSMGALVSLVYNRGGDTDPSHPRRVHMYQIKNAMQQRQFNAIPGYIRGMKDLWRNEKEAKGLLVRRELEAVLFEAGLS